jgi:hypothetical protein
MNPNFPKGGIPLQVPDVLAQAKQRQAMEINQLYSGAFQIFLNLLPLVYPNSEVPIDQVVNDSIQMSKIFHEGVRIDIERNKG